MKQIGGFEIPLYKHAVKVFVGLPADNRIPELLHLGTNRRLR